MNIVVCIKQVPDTTEVRIDPNTNTLIREGVPSIVNPDDLHAIEAAVRLRERFGGRVTAISMGPPQAEKALRRAISLGVDDAILLSDRAFAAADTYATTYVLWLAVQRLASEEPIDLIFCGRQAIDGDTGQVGPGLARRLGFPLLGCVTRIRSLDPETKRIVAERSLDGDTEVLEARLPAVLTVTAATNEVRYASLPNMIRAMEYKVDTWNAEALEANPACLGLRGSPTKVIRSFVPEAPRRRAEQIAGPDTPPERAAAILADKLVELGLVSVGSGAER